MKKKILIISSILILALSLTACGVKDKAIKEIKGVDIKAYMQEDQKDLKEFKEAYIKDMEKVKNDKEAEKLLKEFKSELKTFATKKDKIKTYNKLVKEQIAQIADAAKREEAEKILASYKDKLNKLKSNKEMEKLTAEINGKISEISGAAFEVTASQVEMNTTAAKAIAQQSAKASSGGSSVSQTASKGTKNRAKQRVWVVDRAAWTETITKYRTETQQYTVYVCNGVEFPDYSSGYAYQDKIYEEEGINTRLYPMTKTRTVQVPYTETINHPEEGHWEYR